MTTKPFYIQNLITKNIFNWNDFDYLLKNHPKTDIELITPEKTKLINFSENQYIYNKNIIFLKAKNYKKDFFVLSDFFKLKVPELNNSTEWDVHVYTGQENDCNSFGAHFDLADNFILQTEGKSRWIVSHAFDIILNPGDAIFIPRNWVHECKPMGKRISLSFPFWYNI